MKRNANPNDVIIVRQKVLFWIIIVAAVVAISVGIVGLGHVQSSDNTSTKRQLWIGTIPAPFPLTNKITLLMKKYSLLPVGLDTVKKETQS